MLPQVGYKFCNCLIIGLTQEKHRIQRASQLHQSPLLDQCCQYLSTHNGLRLGTTRRGVRVFTELSQELRKLLLLRGGKGGYKSWQANKSTRCTCCADSLCEHTFFLQCQENLCCHLWRQI